MKLIKSLFTKRQLLAILVGLVAGGGVAQAQFTGIGHTNPQATLHIIPVTVGQEPLRVESMIDLTTETTYTDVLLYDPASGLMRRESVADLLDDNGQWIVDGSGNLVPRNAPFNGDFTLDGSSVGIAVPTNIVGNTNITGTFGVTGNTTLTGTASVSGTSTLTGVVTLGTVNDLATPVAATDQILFHNTTTGAIEKADVSDVIADASYWDEDSDVLTPSNTLIEDEVRIADGDVDINATDIDFTGTNVDVTGAFGVTGASTLTGTLNVTQAADFDNTVNIDNTLSIGTVAQVAVGDIVAADEILMQQAGTNLVEYVTVGDLLASNSYWDEDSDVLTPSNTLIEDEVRIADGDVDINATDIDFTGTNVDVTGAFGVTGASTLTGTLNVTQAADFDNTVNIDNTLSIGTVAQVAVGDIVAADEILMQQAGTNLVEYVTVGDLLASNSYWDEDSDVLTPSNTLIEDEVRIADGDVDINATDIDFTGTNVDVTGAFGVTGASTLTGTLNVTNDADFDTNVNIDGTLDIGTVAQVLAADLDGTDEVLIQQAGSNRVEYVTVADLVSSNGEWVYDATNTRIYARRAAAGGADVWVTDAGNHVVEIAAAYQFADATNQVTATGITATANYTMTLGGNLSVNTAANEDVAFTEAGAGVPWLFYAADGSYTPTNAFGSEAGRVGINTNSPEATLHVAGNIVASNSTVSSDRRFKKDIKDLNGALDVVNSLRGVSYDFRQNEFPKENFDGREHIGFIAQEIREVLPQTVFERGDGFLTVDYAAVTPVLVEAVKELSKQVEALQAENATLRSTSDKSVGAVSTKQLRDLEARLADMDARLQEVAGRK